MKRKIETSFLQVLSLVLFLSGGSAILAQNANKPHIVSEGGLAAIVGDEVITYGELDRKVLQRIAKVVGNRPVSPALIAQARNDFRRVLLEEMVRDSLLLQEAKKEEIEVFPRQIDKEINDRIGRFRKAGQNIRDTDEFYKSLLESEGMTRVQYREKVHKEIMINIILWTKAFRPEFITPGELREFYRVNRESFQKASEYTFRMILILPSDDIQEKLNIIDGALDNRVEFSEVARQTSAIRREAGGFWKMKAEEVEKMADNLKNAIYQMKEGEMRRRIQTPRGWVYLKMIKIARGEVEKFEKVQERIKDLIIRQRRLEDENRFVERLKNKYPMKIFIPEINEKEKELGVPKWIKRFSDPETPPKGEPKKVKDLSEEASKNQPKPKVEEEKKDS